MNSNPMSYATFSANYTHDEMREWNDSVYNIVQHQLDAESAWMDSVMKVNLPPKIYRWAKSGIPFAVLKAALYLEKEGIRLRVYTGSRKREIVRGEEVIGTFLFP